MRSKYHSVLSTLLLLVVMLPPNGNNAAESNVPTAGPSRVSVIEQNGTMTLMLNDQPFLVNGAGMGYSDEQGVATLAAAGGNAFRTWDADALDVQLEAAARYGLMVLVGLDLGKELQGFDYNDRSAIGEQHKRLMAIVNRHRHHPNVLGWILGNEPNLMVGGDGELVSANPLVYTAIGKLASAINKVDPDHPVTVAFAFTPTLADDIATAMREIPDLDFISLQAYGALPVIPQVVQDLGIELPFMITEYGPLGHWEMPATDWGREIEELSGYKAQGMRARMNGSVIDDPTGQMIGSFAFLWGHKQERTPTWYGLFLESGERIASVDELTHVWTGNWPENRAPAAWSMELQGEVAGASVKVGAGERVLASAVFKDPENDELTVWWELLGEVGERSHGGHFEQTPDSVELGGPRKDMAGDAYQLAFDAPAKQGEYRLFVYAVDDAGGAATANIPFLVE